MNQIELAWAAGFFDGEGNTHAAHMRKGRIALHLTVGQVNRKNLERFRAALGDIGRISRPYDRGNKPFSVYRAYGAQANECLGLLWPYLGNEKRDQALKALVIYAFRSASNVASMEVCSRGHRYAETGTYFAPDGVRECAECRKLRRVGTIPRARVTAIERGIGVRQYTPPPIIRSFTPETYSPSIESQPVRCRPPIPGVPAYEGRPVRRPAF